MELRGFDTYLITLGDEMRGERASMGKSLRDVENDLRISGKLIEGIENCDLSAFPNKSVIAGYVRCYARYLGMEVDSTYRRFCEESGFRSPVAMFGADDGQKQAQSNPLNAQVGAQLAMSRFAGPPIPRGFSLHVSFGGIVSGLALMTVLGGVSYGGYALLQDIQRVGFAPLVEAPEIVADAPAIDEPEIEAAWVRPDASVYDGEGALAGASLPSELPQPTYLRRDGPISAIDPATYGVFARPEVDRPLREGLASGVIDSADDAIMAQRVQDSASGLTGNALDGNTLAGAVLSGVASGDTLASVRAVARQEGMAVLATEDSWVRIRENRSTVLFEGTLSAGEQFDLPELLEDAVLRAGNAGGVYLLVDGVFYGPMGERGKVLNMALVAEEIRESLPKAENIALNDRSGDELIEIQAAQRAAVDID